METKEKKICPHCGKEILATAKKCKHCKQWLEDKSISQDDENTDGNVEMQSSVPEITNLKSDKPFRKKRKNIWIAGSLGIIILAFLPLGINWYKEDSIERDKEQYRQWLMVHSYGEVDYRKYSHFKDYVEAALDKKSLKFKGYNGSFSVNITLIGFGNQAIARVRDEENVRFEGTFNVNDDGILLCDSSGVEKYRITFSGEEPATFHEILYEKLNSDLGAATLYKSYN